MNEQMDDNQKRYLHGTSLPEQRRLVAQAEYWRETLVLPGLRYKPSERLLEIGCGAGAVLGVFATAFPGIELAGIDLSIEQLDFAREHLAGLGVSSVDLRHGNAAKLPWADGTFDHIYMMWMLEHVKDAEPFLAEAFRVLKPGGSIAIRETDYTSFRVLPRDPNWEKLRSAQLMFFSKNGNAEVGRLLGPLLVSTGFVDVTSELAGFHFFQDGLGATRLRAHVYYMNEFLKPALPAMGEAAGVDLDTMRRGLEHLLSLPNRSRASVTQEVYKASGYKPDCDCSLDGLVEPECAT